MRITGPISIPFTSGNRHNPPYGPATMKRHYRRNARPNERDIETVRVVKRRNPNGKNGYIAFYKNKQMEVYADTSANAQQIAAKAFKARKSYEVHVELAEKDGTPVIHTATNPRRRTLKRRNPKSKKRRVGRRISVTAAASRLAYFRHHHNPPITAAQASALRAVLTGHGYAVNPRKRKHKRVVRKHKRVARKHRVVRKHRKVARRTVRKIKVPKGKRVGSFFKRKGKYFRVSSVKIRKGRKVIRRRVARKSSARAAKRAHK